MSVLLTPSLRRSTPDQRLLIIISLRWNEVASIARPLLLGNCCVPGSETSLGRSITKPIGKLRGDTQSVIRGDVERNSSFLILFEPQFTWQTDWPAPTDVAYEHSWRLLDPEQEDLGVQARWSTLTDRPRPPYLKPQQLLDRFFRQKQQNVKVSEEICFQWNLCFRLSQGSEIQNSWSVRRSPAPETLQNRSLPL